MKKFKKLLKVTKPVKVFLNAIPVIVMIGLIPFVKSDLVLTAIDMWIIVVALMIKKEKKDMMFLAFWFCIMIASEYFFISTGVETFQRRSLLGVMPLWLPVLRAYGFVAMKRSIRILYK